MWCVAPTWPNSLSKPSLRVRDSPAALGTSTSVSPSIRPSGWRGLRVTVAESDAIVIATVVEAAPAASTTPVEATPPAPAEFDPASVAESTATLPPFPFLGIPEGLQSTFDEKDKNVPFDRHYFIAGNKAVAMEGKIFHDRFNLTIGPRTYSDLEFRRNYENAIVALGGRKINDTQYTLDVVKAAGGRDELEKTNQAAGMNPDYPHDIYLIRQAGKEY